HPPEISNVTSVPPVFVQKLTQNYLYYNIPFYSRFYLCMQKFTCGSNAHNSPSFTTHSGLWAWNSPHPLPSSPVSLSLSRERLSRKLTMIDSKKSKLISYYGQITILWMMLITISFNILRVCIRIYISHHFVFPRLTFI